MRVRGRIIIYVEGDSSIVKHKIRMDTDQMFALYNLVESEIDRLGEFQRTGVGLSAITAHKRSVTLRPVYKELKRMCGAG